jgi:DNA repair exonuclease SbcCD ATPase subunit
MQLKSIEATDFLSIEKVSYEFPSSGLVLVTGWDEDLGRANGAGKSSFLNAIAWCLYDELPRDVKVGELIRRGQSSCSVTVEFTVDGTSYSVTRKRPSGLELVINGDKQKGNPKFIQAMIEQIVGLSYKQFLITSYFPQKGDSSRFLKQNDSTAKDFLGTILNFNKTESAYKKLHMEVKEAEMKLAAKKGEYDALQSSLASMKQMSLMPVPPMPSKDEILKVKADQEEVNRSTASVPDTAAIDADIEKVKFAVQKVQSARYELSSLERTIQDKLRKIDHVGQSANHFLTCPSCSAELLESAGQLVAFDESAAEQVKQDKIDALNSEIAELQQRLEKIRPMVEKEDAFQLKLDSLKAKRLQARHDYDLAMQKKSHLASQMAGFKQAIIQHQQAKEAHDKLAKQLSELEISLASKATDLLVLEQDYLLLSAAKGVMSPTGAIAYSLDSVMSDLNDEVGQFLDVFSHNTMTYKITSGDDKAKVTHTLTKGGQDVSVGSLSGGEERGLILSVDLGLANVIAARSGVNLPSVLMLDECFEGLDYVGKERVIDALREISKDRCIIVIDHSTEFNALFDQMIKIVKKSEVSRLEVT